MLHVRPPLALLLSAALMLSLSTLRAADEKNPDAPKPAEKKAEAKPEEKKDKTKSIAEFTKDMAKIDGLLPVYRDKKTGEAHLLVRKNQLDKEFILFAYTENGLAKFGHFRGCFREARVITFRRDYNKISFVAQDTGHYFDPKSPLSRAKDANISPAVIVTQKIEAEDEKTGDALIAMEGPFLNDVLYQLKPTRESDNKDAKLPSLGKLNTYKNRYVSIRNYPANLDVIVEYVYDDASPTPGKKPEYDAADPRYISVNVQYSFIEMPHNDYVPRFDDERVGYFSTRVDDMTSAAAVPYRDLIHRWHLKKKDPAAPLSEPVEPITWWIENTTPLELRDTIRDAALQWNKAFEAAGFKNALVVKIQPDDAKWDAGDIRYNVLRWTSSPNPPFGGYGPSFVNPRTGQILGADIMLEWTFVTNRLRTQKLFDTPAAASADGQPLCAAGDQLHASTVAAQHMLKASGALEVDRQKLLKESLYYLVLHELGHTLGLNHNMKSSHWLPLDKLSDESMTRELGLIGSIMDYPAVNIAGPNRPQGQFYSTCPGPYDRWAIEFGYSPRVDDPAYRKKLLARSTEPGLAFGNDADDMRSPGRGIDPRVNVGDMSADAITFAAERIARVKDAMSKAVTKYTNEDGSYQELRDAYASLTREHMVAASVISRYVGGVYVERAAPGQKDAPAPLTPVPAAEQRRAMATLRKHVFAPDALEAPAKLLAYARQQRRSFDFFDENEDLRLHQQLMRVHAAALEHLLNPAVLTRLSDTRLYGNDYSVTAMLGELTDAIFADDTPGDVNTIRQNLQAEYVSRLIAASAPGRHDYLARAAAEHQLRRLEKLLNSTLSAFATRPNEETRAHREALLLRIGRALAVKAD